MTTETKTVGGVCYKKVPAIEWPFCDGCEAYDAVMSGKCRKLCHALGDCHDGTIWIKEERTPTVSEVAKRLTPQAQQLLGYLIRTGTVTQREALLDLKIQSLTKRISELRDYFNISSEFKVHPSTGQRYMRYTYEGLIPGVEA